MGRKIAVRCAEKVWLLEHRAVPHVLSLEQIPTKNDDDKISGCKIPLLVDDCNQQCPVGTNRGAGNWYTIYHHYLLFMG